MAKTDTIRIPQGDIEYSTTLETISCGKCGVVFALPESFIGARRKDHETFYCPNGHPRYYPQENETERLRRQLKEAESHHERLRRCYEEKAMDLADEKRRHASTKGQLTKTKKRIANGVCPCCHRHFVNLERHMKGQHPEYVEAPDA